MSLPWSLGIPAAGEESPPGYMYTTPAAVTRALRSGAAGSELAALEHEPERQLRRQRQSLNDRLELEGEEAAKAHI